MHCKDLFVHEKGTLRPWTTFVIALTAGGLVVGAAFFSVAVYNNTQENEHVANEPKTKNAPVACVDCSMLTLGLTDDLSADPLIGKLSTKIENRRLMCCAENMEQTSALLELIMRRQVPAQEPLPSHNASDFKFSPVSAHKRIYPEHLSHDFGNIHVPQMYRTCHFKRRNHNGLEHHRGVDMLRKGIRVKHRGLYYIYSGIHFRPQSTLACKEFDYQTLTHSIHIVSRYVSRRVLKTTYTCCDDCVNNQESRYTGGVFLLERGDVIQVKVMEYRLVHFEPESSFAGVAMMGGVVEDDETEEQEEENREELTGNLPRVPPLVHKSLEVDNVLGRML